LSTALGAGSSPEDRRLAADVLLAAKLDETQRIALADRLSAVSPTELNRLLGAFQGTTDPALLDRVLTSLEQASARASLQADALAAVVKGAPEAARTRADALLATLKESAGVQIARIEALLPAVASGDIRRGQAVFQGEKAACSTCHAIGYLGGKVGPDLTRIGSIRTERDLLEAVLYPSASFVRSYEPVLVATTDGRVASGILTRDAPDELVLTTGAEQVARIPRAEVEQVEPGTVSVMPSGLDQQLSAQELADLIAFLKACQ
jgi:putative heme-binding domain-containing protein